MKREALGCQRVKNIIPWSWGVSLGNEGILGIEGLGMRGSSGRGRCIPVGKGFGKDILRENGERLQLPPKYFPSLWSFRGPSQLECRLLADIPHGMKATDRDPGEILAKREKIGMQVKPEQEIPCFK